MTQSRQKQKQTPARLAVQILGLVLCVIFGLMLICNLTIIIKGAINPDIPPSVIGVTPLAVQSGSMSGDAPDHFEVGDLIFVRPADTDKLKVGDIIAFTQGKSVVTHRIVRMETTEQGARVFITKGDANNAEDTSPVSPEAVLGRYSGRIPKLGELVLFSQQPGGMALFIGLPVLVFVLYDAITHRRESAIQRKQTQELEQELEWLRAEGSYADAEYEDAQYEDEQYADEQYDAQYEDEQYEDEQYEDAQYADEQYDAQYEDTQYADEQYDALEYEDAQYEDAQYEDAQEETPRRESE